MADDLVLLRRTMRPDGTVVEEFGPRPEPCVPESIWSRPVSVGQLAKAFGCHRDTIDARITDGSLPAIAWGNLWRVRRDHAPDLETFRFHTVP